MQTPIFTDQHAQAVCEFEFMNFSRGNTANYALFLNKRSLGIERNDCEIFIRQILLGDARHVVEADLLNLIQVLPAEVQVAREEPV